MKNSKRIVFFYWFAKIVILMAVILYTLLVYTGTEVFMQYRPLMVYFFPLIFLSIMTGMILHQRKSYFWAFAWLPVLAVYVTGYFLVHPEVGFLVGLAEATETGAIIAFFFGSLITFFLPKPKL